jgi:hypothetical protein
MTDLDDIEAKLTDAETSRLYFHWMLERSLDDIEQVTNELVYISKPRRREPCPYGPQEVAARDVAAAWSELADVIERKQKELNK